MHDDALALGRLVAERGEERRLGKLRHRHGGDRIKRRRLAIAVRDRARLVEQQHVTVARGLDGTARRRDDIGAHHPPHPGHADRGEQAADRRRDQAHQQRHEHRNRHRRSGLSDLYAVERIRQQGHRCQQKHQCHRNQQDSECDLVGRFTPFGAFDHADHAVEEGLTGIDVDAHDDPVRQHACAAGDGVEVAACGAYHRRTLASDRGFVDRRHALDHLAVAWDEIALLYEHDVTLAQIRRRRWRLRPISFGAHQALGRRVSARALERSGLRLAPPLGDGLGEIGEEERHPEP